MLGFSRPRLSSSSFSDAPVPKDRCLVERKAATSTSPKGAHRQRLVDNCFERMQREGPISLAAKPVPRSEKAIASPTLRWTELDDLPSRMELPKRRASATWQVVDSTCGCSAPLVTATRQPVDYPSGFVAAMNTPSCPSSSTPLDYNFTHDDKTMKPMKRSSERASERGQRASSAAATSRLKDCDPDSNSLHCRAVVTTGMELRHRHPIPLLSVHAVVEPASLPAKASSKAPAGPPDLLATGSGSEMCESASAVTVTPSSTCTEGFGGPGSTPAHSACGDGSCCSWYHCERPASGFTSEATRLEATYDGGKDPERTSSPTGRYIQALRLASLRVRAKDDALDQSRPRLSSSAGASVACSKSVWRSASTPQLHGTPGSGRIGAATEEHTPSSSSGQRCPKVSLPSVLPRGSVTHECDQSFPDANPGMFTVARAVDKFERGLAETSSGKPLASRDHTAFDGSSPLASPAGRAAGGLDSWGTATASTIFQTGSDLDSLLPRRPRSGSLEGPSDRTKAHGVVAPRSSTPQRGVAKCRLTRGTPTANWLHTQHAEEDIRRMAPCEKIYDFYFWDKVLQEDGDGGKVVICKAKEHGEWSRKDVCFGEGGSSTCEDHIRSKSSKRAFNYVMKIRSKNLFRLRQQELRYRNVLLRMLNLPRHEGIVRYHEVLEDEDFYYVVTERCTGGSFFGSLLFQYGDGVMPPDAVRNLLQEIFEALGHVHSHGMLHRDIKPDNLVMQGTNRESPMQQRVVLIDFDHADPGWSPRSPAVPVQQLFGTLRFIAPECFLGRYSQESDLYSVGAILYLLMTGGMPYCDDFFGEEIQETPTRENCTALYRRLGRTSVSWEAEAWSTQPLCRDLCQRLIAFEPHNRPHSAEEAMEHAFFIATLAEIE